MLAKNRNVLVSALFIGLAAIACNLPSATSTPTEPPAENNTETPTPTFTSIAPVSETPSPTAMVEVCKPTVTTNTIANVRSGPGQVYGVIGSIPQGGTANVAGKNFDNTWWYIEFAGGSGGFGWIAGSVTSAVCIPDTLASIAAPPTPVLPSATPTYTQSPTAVPSATSTSSGGIILLPPIFLLPSPTPTPFFLFPILPIGP